MKDNDDHDEIPGLTAEIVSAYVSKNPLAANDLPRLITDVAMSLRSLGAPATTAELPAPTPAVPVKKSITDDHIICLDDGKKFKSLKRHLMTHYNLTPEQYRAKWGLPGDYPMTAPNYSATRSRLAKVTGLGRTNGALAH